MHINVHQFKMKRKIKATELLINITGKDKNQYPEET